MAKALQVHISTPATDGTIHMMTWIEAGLKPREGMILEAKGDKRRWTVVAAYSIPTELDGLTPWKEVL